MTTISRIYNSVLNFCISNRQIKLEIWRKTKEAKGNPKIERELATEFLKKAKSADERYEIWRGEKSLQAFDESELYFQAACRLVGVVMSMAIYDSIHLENRNSGAYSQF